MKSMVQNTVIRTQNAVFYPLFLIAIMWVVQVFNATIFNYSLNTYGILPRTFEGLTGLIFSPFLHGNYNHIISNSVMFLILSSLICFYDVKIWIKSLILGGLIGGFITWSLGSVAYHVGASGLIFTLWGTIFGIAIYHKKFFFIFAAIVLFLMFGISMIIGLIPQNGISFAGHFGGLVAGVMTAGYINFKK